MVIKPYYTNNGNLQVFPATLCANNAETVSQRKHQIPWMEQSTLSIPDCKTPVLCKWEKKSQKKCSNVHENWKKLIITALPILAFSQAFLWHYLFSLKANHSKFIPGSTQNSSHYSRGEFNNQNNILFTFLFPVLLITPEIKCKSLPCHEKSLRTS